MPYAFKEGGLVSGSVTILVVAVLSAYGVRLLLRVKRHMASSGQGALCSTFGSIAQHVLGVWGKRLVNAFLVSVQPLHSLSLSSACTGMQRVLGCASPGSR
jgi:amino acid permease